ncbi:MAG: rhamnulokinase [Alistipes sp.]|nr:rhamnulokinase [Alistipes sp.]
MEPKHFLAFDLGATSGRTILGTISGGKLSMKELTRFPNTMVALSGHFYWNIYALYEHLKAGFAAAAKEGVTITSAGIDTWGVDFAFIGEDGCVLGMPYAYRDPHTTTAHTECFERIMPREEIYDITGIQIMNFNSMYQLYAMKRDDSSQLKHAKKLLFMPDALSYMLTGKMVTEYTIASTSQLLNPRTKKMDERLLGALEIDENIFPPVVFPGHVVGNLLKDIADETGIGEIPVIAVAGHDTASAVAAVPASDEKFAYLSSGTWSLMGIEVKEPVITPATSTLNITNEGGVEGTTRLLKNITGMWIVEQCLKEWKKQGAEISYSQMVQLAEEAPAFKAFIDPDHSSFANPQSMIAAIDAYLTLTGQERPATYGEYIRIIFESLALKYRATLDMFRALAPFEINKLHIIGGGSKNALLNRFTANATGIPVIAGPSEATAIGNIMIQARTAGMVGSLQEMRDMIANGIETTFYEPHYTDIWNDAYRKFTETINKLN